MDNLIVTPLSENEPIPYELLVSADPSLEAINIYLPYSTIYVSHLHDEIIAVYVLFPLNAEEIEIKNIAVHETYQGLGIGKALLADATQRATNEGYKNLSIGTSNASIAQLALYQRQGFELSGLKMNFFIDNYTEPLFENGIQCKHMLMLTKTLQ
ncbi:GNAT family N-acetyltransferase [Emticicia fontis]